MKMMRALAITAGAVLAAAFAQAQVNTVILTRTEAFTQNGATLGDLTPISATPYSFSAAIEGISVGTGVLTLPDGITTHNLTTNGTRLLYISGSFATLGAMTTAFPDSTNTNTPLTGSYYTLQVPDTRVANIGLSSDLNTLATPFITLTGGTWVGAVYQFNPASTVTVSFNNISSAAGNFHYNADVNGTNLGGTGPEAFIAGNTAPPSFTIQSLGTPLAGNSYTIQVNYDYIQFLNNDVFGDASNVTGAGLFEFQTTINLQAIPEPAAAAELAGALALLGVITWRRRR